MQDLGSESTKAALIRRIRIWLALFIAGLVLSGLTAFPLERELALLNHLLNVSPVVPAGPEPGLHTWLRRVHEGLADTNQRYQFFGVWHGLAGFCASRDCCGVPRAAARSGPQ
jgi:hypothetical protein